MRNKILFIVLNNSCNLACTYCFYNQEPQRRKSNVIRDNIEKYHSVIDSLPSLGFAEVTITGGEPLLMFDSLINLASRCKRAGLVVNLNTNGTLLTKAKARELYQAGVNNLYLNSVVIDHKSTVLLRFLGKIFNTYIIHVVTGNNAEYLSSTIKKVENIGACLILQPGYINMGTIVDGSMSLTSLRKEVLTDVIDRISQVPNNSKVGEIMADYYIHSNRTQQCDMGSRRFVLDCNGEVYPCFHRYQYPMGNILTRDITGIIRDSVSRGSVTKKSCFGEHCISLFV